ncbi:hypothetical protein LDENG_00003030 [Lucifuga dentata]|nr:hypothetical protein LDENG_00003030 [Lucifuga dentata]
METPDGYCASNGQCSPRKENSIMLVDTSTPNGQRDPKGPNSPSEPTIKQEEEAIEEADSRSTAHEEMGQSGEEGPGLEESMNDSPTNLQDRLPGSNLTADSRSRQPNGDRPFQCTQCGVSFTQKGNLLRHIKLHTGEKPFKCPFCSYACRRRDALTGHLRTHAVGKPHKCNYCGRSYKQRTSLDEHKDRCHTYTQGAGIDPTTNASHYTGEVPKESRIIGEPSNMVPFDRQPVIERLSNVGKRKSTTPQKFVGEKVVRYNYPELSYEMGLKYEKQAELMQAHMIDSAISNAITYMGSDSLQPMIHHPGPPLSIAEVVPMVNPLFHHVLPLGQRTERPGSCDPLPQQPQLPPHHSNFAGHPTSNGPAALARHDKQQPQPGQESPSNSGVDSVDSARSSPQDRQSYHGSNLSFCSRLQDSPVAGYSGDQMPVASPRSGIGLCEHCRVLFLDHVMYTIHMGCHGYRDPLECNICGHRSKDRYEFSSHIVRGEHTFQ